MATGAAATTRWVIPKEEARLVSSTREGVAIKVAKRDDGETVISRARYFF